MALTNGLRKKRDKSGTILVKKKAVFAINESQMKMYSSIYIFMHMLGHQVGPKRKQEELMSGGANFFL